jgi:hypothetical protein
MFEINDTVYVAMCYDRINRYLSTDVHEGFIKEIHQTADELYYGVWVRIKDDPMAAVALEDRVPAEYVYPTREAAQCFAIEEVIRRRQNAIRSEQNDIRERTKCIENNKTAIKGLREWLKKLENQSSVRCVTKG